MRKSSVSSKSPILILSTMKRYLFDSRCSNGDVYEVEYTIGDDNACRLIDAIIDVFNAETALANRIFCLGPSALKNALK